MGEVFSRRVKMSDILSLEERLRILVPISKKEIDPNGDYYLTISNDYLERIDVKKSVQGFDTESAENGLCFIISQSALRNEKIHISTSYENFKTWYCNMVSQSINPREHYNLFLVGDIFYNSKDLQEQDFSKKMVESCDVVLALWKMADINTGKNIIFYTDKSTIIEIEFMKEWIFDASDRAKQFGDIALSKDPSDEPLKMLLKSEICSVLINFKEEERMKKFCELFKTIMDNFSFSLGAYMKKYSTDEIKKKFNDMILDTDKKIKESLSGLKTELAVFLSMYFAMSGFRSSSSSSDIVINRIIITSLFVVAFVYVLVLLGDYNSLSDIIRSCKDIIEEINQKKETSNSTLNEIKKRIKGKRNKAIFYKVIIILVGGASFAPPIMALFM